MNRSVAAVCMLVLLVLCAVTTVLNLPRAVSTALYLVLILAAAVIGAKVNRR